MLDTAGHPSGKSGQGIDGFPPIPSSPPRSKGNAMSNIQLIPAYGRDYKSQREVQEAWDANKDFWTADVIRGYGVATNKEDCAGMDLRVVIRYARGLKLYAVK
jgi:hypothetical protein